LKCSYREIPPQKSEKQVLQITSQLDSLAEDVKAMAQRSEEREGKIDQLLAQQNDRLAQQNDKMNMLLEHFMQSRPTPAATMDVAMTDPPNHTPMRAQERPSPAQPPPPPFGFCA
jgi:ElaB/YqjD/DUF883 family membrane-anchored ribosome-binding protein